MQPGLVVLPSAVGSGSPAPRPDRALCLTGVISFAARLSCLRETKLLEGTAVHRRASPAKSRNARVSGTCPLQASRRNAADPDAPAAAAAPPWLGRRWLAWQALACRCEGVEHLDCQAASPARQHCALDPQPRRAGRLLPGRRGPPQFCGQRRGYRVVKFAADFLKLPLQPGHYLWRQGGLVDLLLRCLQQRPDAQQPAGRFYPAG